LVILIDKETHSLWDHITGEAIEGPLKGQQLDVWSVKMGTAQTALNEYPEITISLSSNHSFYKWLAQTLYPKFIHAKVLLPFFFRWSMQSEIDPRLPELTQGLGIILNGQAKYYPLSTIPLSGLEDRWLNRPLRVELKKTSGVPDAVWQDTGEYPMQLLSRWYGFSFTYPHCEIYKS
jgi:hypothetical protein